MCGNNRTLAEISPGMSYKPKMPRATHSIISQPGRPGSKALLCPAPTKNHLPGPSRDKAHRAKPPKGTQCRQKGSGIWTNHYRGANHHVKPTAPQAGNSRYPRPTLSNRESWRAPDTAGEFRHPPALPCRQLVSSAFLYFA